MASLLDLIPFYDVIIPNLVFQLYFWTRKFRISELSINLSVNTLLILALHLIQYAFLSLVIGVLLILIIIAALVEIWLMLMALFWNFPLMICSFLLMFWSFSLYENIWIYLLFEYEIINIRMF